MKLEGERVRVKRWVHGRRCVVQVEVDAVIPVDDPSEPCFEPATVGFLKQVHEHADEGDVDWLNRIGTVYVPLSA